MLYTKAKILQARLKILAYNIIRFTLSLVWRKALNRDKSINILQDSVVYQSQDQPLIASPCPSVDHLLSLSFENYNNSEHKYQKKIYFEPHYVWKLEVNKPFKSLSLSSLGIALLNNKYLLDLDYGNTSGYKEAPIKFNIVEYPLVVAPWSHGISFSYFGFVALILTKLCRMEEALGQEIWQNAKLCYPLYNTRYEKEYLQKLGIPESAIIDTRTKGLKIQAKSLILANSQTFLNRISPQDIQRLRTRFLSGNPRQNKRKLFFSRRGKRLIENEPELRELVTEFGFEIIEDMNRSVDEQIALYQDAAIIIAPHGAGLTNLVWCQPGTKVIELFYGGYRKAGFYYLCQVLGLDYSFIVDHNYSEENFVNQYHNMTINAAILKKELQRVLTLVG